MGNRLNKAFDLVFLFGLPVIIIIFIVYHLAQGIAMVRSSDLGYVLNGCQCGSFRLTTCLFSRIHASLVLATVGVGMALFSFVCRDKKKEGGKQDDSGGRDRRNAQEDGIHNM